MPKNTWKAALPKDECRNYTDQKSTRLSDSWVDKANLEFEDRHCPLRRRQHESERSFDQYGQIQARQVHHRGTRGQLQAEDLEGVQATGEKVPLRRKPEKSGNELLLHPKSEQDETDLRAATTALKSTLKADVKILSFAPPYLGAGAGAPTADPIYFTDYGASAGAATPANPLVYHSDDTAAAPIYHR